MNIFRTFLDAAKEVIAEVVATYRIHWEEDNRRLAAARKQAQDEQALIASRPDYELVAEMLVDAVNNTIDVTHLHEAKNIRRLLVGSWLVRKPSGLIAFVYRARRFVGYSVTAADIQRILQAELDQLCEVYAYAPLVVHVVFMPAGAVKIEIAYAADCYRIRANAIREVL